MKFFQGWRKTVKRAGDEKDWFDAESFRGMWYSLALTALMLAGTITAMFYYGPWTAILGGCMLLVLTLSFLIPHRTEEGERLAQNWKALKRYLLRYHYRTADASMLMDRLDEYFIYGVVLGMTTRITKELAALVPADRAAHIIPWYAYHGSSAGFSPDAFATSFGAMVASTTAAMSSAAGVGGGASAGGGGAGGGGGGAG